MQGFPPTLNGEGAASLKATPDISCLATRYLDTASCVRSQDRGVVVQLRPSRLSKAIICVERSLEAALANSGEPQTAAALIRLASRYARLAGELAASGGSHE